ncbi:flagellar hook-associated protein 2 [Lysinibacillus piscis]|uniref:Flagellar hook-associated protein 2 n=1 Tax=Lysinibacillus piscis TaxID=2518931 RepID=A0ABQ5NHG6_9BACI|nr:flagellar hook-associated protein 2 [Lysinibacillus sp. KH24]GLC87789.1 flagellar hook-associated protein 2 [Lysinibacillus sp. KH24]
MVMRIGGLASGMDIDALVEKLMSAERAPLNKLFQNKQKYEWQRDAYRDVNKKLKTFDMYISDNLVLKSFNTKTVNNSNSNLITATASSSASGTLTIEKVEELATAARVVGGKIGDNTTTEKTKLSAIGISGTLEIKSPQNNGNVAPIEITSDMTVEDLVKKINNSNAGVTAVFEKGQFSLTAKNTGLGSIEITGSAKDALKLDIDAVSNQAGKNSKFVVNGIETERTSNTFSMNGYNVTLKSTFNTSTSTESISPVTLASTSNVDDMMKKIKDFVATYNELVKDFSGQTKEAKYRDYAPLTEEQKKDMKENEIKLWDEKAKSGLLRNDALIRDGLSKMRALVYETNPALEGSKYNSLFNIGITTSKNYNEGGTLEIDEVKLRKALEEDPDAVEKLFKNSSGKKEDIIDGKTVDTRGYLEKLRYDAMKSFEVSIEKKAGRSTMTDAEYAIGKNLKDLDSRIKTWQNKMKDVEARYWKQFSAMESAINKANQQSSLFMQGQ